MLQCPVSACGWEEGYVGTGMWYRDLGRWKLEMASRCRGHINQMGVGVRVSCGKGNGNGDGHRYDILISGLLMRLLLAAALDTFISACGI
jgi:hypothetical protein